MFLLPSISNEPLDGLSWNCSIIFSTSKWKAELFFSRSFDLRLPTDRHICLKPIFGHNSVLDWDIDLRFGVWVGFVNPNNVSNGIHENHKNIGNCEIVKFWKVQNFS